MNLLGAIRRRRANVATALLIFVVIPPLTARTMPRLIQQHNWLSFDKSIATALAALSLNVLLGYAGQISLGQAGLVGLGAFVAGNIMTRWPLPFPVALVAAACASALVALVIGGPALRLRGLYLSVVTVLFALAMQYTVFPSSLLSSGSSGVAVPTRLWGHHYLTDDAWLAVICLVCLVGVWVLDDNLTRTRVGRAFKSIRDNEEAAQSFGIDVTRYKLMAFVVSGAMAGLAGALYGQSAGHVNSDYFDMFQWSLPLVIIVIVGGAGHRLAVILAGVAYTLLPQLLGGAGSRWLAWTPVFGAFALLLTISRHPGGLADLLGHRAAQGRGRHDGPDTDEVLVPALPVIPAVARSAGAETDTVLEVEGIRVTFGGLVAVDRASLRVPAHQIVGLIGPNGAGKSTLFNAISGAVRADAGVVRFRGSQIQGMRADQRARLGIARSFQQVGLASDLTVRENFLLAQHQLASYGDAAAALMLPAAVAGEAELGQRADEAMAALGFTSQAAKPLKQLSGGQQRIVEIACLLLTAPELLMLDEPSAGMAPAAAENLADRLRELRDVHGRTVLLIEHNVPLVMDVCDYVYVLDAGRVVAEGTPDQVASDERVIEAYFGAAVPA